MTQHLKLVEDDDEGAGYIRYTYPDGCTVVISDKGEPPDEDGWELIHKTVHKYRD